jgi:hypothetical protein
VTVQIQNPGKSGLISLSSSVLPFDSGSMVVGFSSDDWKVGRGMLPTTGFFGCGLHGSEAERSRVVSRLQDVYSAGESG